MSVSVAAYPSSGFRRVVWPCVYRVVLCPVSDFVCSDCGLSVTLSPWLIVVSCRVSLSVSDVACSSRLVVLYYLGVSVSDFSLSGLGYRLLYLVVFFFVSGRVVLPGRVRIGLLRIRPFVTSRCLAVCVSGFSLSGFRLL